MPFLYLAAIDTAVLLAAVILPGLAATARIQSLRPQFANDPPSSLLASAAIGLVLNALIFLIGYRLRIDFTRPASFALIQAIHIGITGMCLASADARAGLKKLLSGLTSDKIFIPMLAASFALGCFALVRFPHSFDSGQLAWTQIVLTGAHSDPWPVPMFGYSALIALPAAWTADLPLVTSAAGYKPFLFTLAMLVAWQATYALDLRPRAVAAAVYVIAMICSTFGSYGLFATGKDSIFGILFMVAMLLSFSREDAETRGLEIGLFLAAASVMGIIAVPYALVAYGLWFLFASPRPWPTLVPVLAINAPVLPAIIAAFARAPAPLIYAAYLVGALGCILALSLLRRFTAARQFKQPEIGILVVTWLAVVVGYFLMPIRVPVIVAMNLNGTPEIRSMAPTDGATTFFGMFASYPAQAVSTALGILAILVLGFTRFGRSRPGLVAAGATVFVSLALVLSHHKIGLAFLSPFNVWDLTKDVPMWLGGSLVTLFSVTLAATVGRRLFRNAGSAALLVALGAAIIVHAYPLVNVPHYLRAPFYAKYAASDFQPMAIAASEVWSGLRGKKLFVYQGSSMAVDDYFFSLQMYGARPVKIDAFFSGVTLDDVSSFIIAPAMAPVLFAMAQTVGASVRYVPVSSDDAEMFVVSRDGKATANVPPSIIADKTPGLVEPLKGTYGLETYEGEFKFSWINRSLELSIVLFANGTACIRPNLFGTGLPGADGNVEILLDGQRVAEISLKDTNIRNQIAAGVSVPAGKQRIVLTLRSLSEPILFKGDPRPISFGVRRPIDLLAQDSCR